MTAESDFFGGSVRRRATGKDDAAGGGGASPQLHARPSEGDAADDARDDADDTARDDADATADQKDEVVEMVDGDAGAAAARARQSVSEYEA